MVRSSGSSVNASAVNGDLSPSIGDCESRRWPAEKTVPARLVSCATRSNRLKAHRGGSSLLGPPES